MKTKKISSRALKFTSAVAISSGESFTSNEPRPFSGIAYSGGEITDHPYWEKVIFDLSTTCSLGKIPLLFGHDVLMPIGNGDISISSNITIEGVIYDDADEKKIICKPNHPWEMSVFIKPSRIEEVLSGASTVVNGNLFTGREWCSAEI